MLKVRYFRIDLPLDLQAFSARLSQIAMMSLGDIKVTRASSEDVVFSYTVTRLITVRKLNSDGDEVEDAVPTLDVYAMRIFKNKNAHYLSIIDPPRSIGVIGKLFDRIMPEEQYFIEALEFKPPLISTHVKSFDAARLVSAKIRDFEVYAGAVGRLEITSQNGLIPEIAPFLENKFYRIDFVTYEVSQGFVKGLAYYYRNGTFKVSSSLIENAFPSFESCFE